jgi:hypothetical protein
VCWLLMYFFVYALCVALEGCIHVKMPTTHHTIVTSMALFGLRSKTGGDHGLVTERQCLALPALTCFKLASQVFFTMKLL